MSGEEKVSITNLEQQESRDNGVKEAQTEQAPEYQTAGNEERMDVTDQQAVDLTPQPGAEPISQDESKLFVGGLHPSTEKDDLRKYFEKFGGVIDVDLKKDQATGKSRGFAFVVMESPSVSESILEEKEHKINEKMVDCKKALPHAVYQAQKYKTKKVFVGGVPVTMPKETIEDYFVQFGKIEEVALVKEKYSEKRRGFVFVIFEEYESVDECTKKAFHTLEGNQVEVKRATPRDEGGMYGGPMGRGYRGRPARGGSGRGGWAPYGGAAMYGGYGGGYNEGYGGGYGYYEDSFEGSYYGGGRGGYGSRYGPMKGNQGYGTRGYHPYGR